MKTLLLIIVVIVGGVYFFNHKQAITKTGISAYNEIRLELTSGSRSVQLVSYIRRDSSESCEAIRVWWVESMITCAAATNCKVLKNQCVNEVSLQYQAMFDEKPSSTTYLKVENPVLGREGVMLFWGLNQDESGELCKQMSQHIKSLAEKNPEIKYRCI